MVGFDSESMRADIIISPDIEKCEISLGIVLVFGSI